MKKRLIVNSLITVLLCISIITGATYAIFTSEADANIAITNGTVSVVASLAELRVYSMEHPAGWTTYDPNDYVLQSDNRFINNGTAELVENSSKLQITNMTPGDAVKTVLKIENRSNVDVRYRVRATVSSLAVSMIKLSVDDEVINDPIDSEAGYFDSNGFDVRDYDGVTPIPDVEFTTVISEWKSFDETNVATHDIFVELPPYINNNAQGLENLLITFTVEAVQGNAAIKGISASITYPEDSQPLYFVVNDGEENYFVKDRIRLYLAAATIGNEDPILGLVSVDNIPDPDHPVDLALYDEYGNEIMGWYPNPDQEGTFKNDTVRRLVIDQSNRVLEKDGTQYTLTAITMNELGVIIGEYKNDDNKSIEAVIFQVPVASFNNPDGMDRVQNGYYKDTHNSGVFDDDAISIGEIATVVVE